MENEKMKKTGLFLAVVLCISGTVFAVLSGGGTSGNPYLIQSRLDFDEFVNPANAATYWASGKYTTLMCDPNLAGTTYTKSPIAPDTSNGTTGVFEGTKFAGVFDGNGHTISNLTINASTKDFVGLFGYVDSAGQIKNLGVVNVNVTGRYIVSGLAGHNDGLLTSCYATGSVTGTNDYIGGLVGRNAGSITSCYATDSVGGDWDVGGLVGYNYGAISNCYAAGTVAASSYAAGGLAGYNGDNSPGSGMILNCHAAGNVTASFDSAGGLVGYNTDSSTISNCYAAGTASGANKVGGLVGYNDSSVAISDCYATGEVTGTGTDYYGVGGLVGYNLEGTLLRCSAAGATHGVREVGGLVGYNRYGSILNCYATGTVTGSSIYIGGLVGYNNSEYGSTPCTISNCYATGAASGSAGVGGLIGFNGYPSATSYCYSTGTATPVGTGTAGGMVGTNQYGTYTACFWDTQTNGRSNSVGFNAGGAITGMLGKLTVEMKQQATFTVSPYLWDFFGETANGTNDYWRMCVDGVNYPRLTWSYVKIGDFACPNGVNVEDLDYYIGWWLSAGCTSANNFCGGADINKSGTVNLEDFSIMAAHWLEGV
jgi:hypothetical protein